MKSFLQCFGEVIVSSNYERNQRPKVQGFFSVVQKKVLRKVYRFEVLEKIN